jgi:hypothetical protein
MRQNRLISSRHGLGHVPLNIKIYIKLVLLLLPGLLPLTERLSAAEAAEEAELVMSAFVFNFAKYVDWPYHSDDGKLHICTVGEGPLNDRLNDLTGQQLSGMQVHVMAASEEDLDQRRCSITVIGLSERTRVSKHLSDPRIQRTLTISQIESFAESGGVIGLFMDGKKVRFAVNTGAADSAGLSISSRLLKLARIVKSSDME